MKAKHCEPLVTYIFIHRVGGVNNFFHCPKCNMCISITLKDSHKVRNQLVCSAEYWPFSGKCSYHIETSELICSVNQLAGFYIMETLHGMHVKNFRKKSVVEGQKPLILEGGSVIGGSMFSVTLREFCGEMKKIHNHSIKDYCSTLQKGQYALTKKNFFRTVRRHSGLRGLFLFGGISTPLHDMHWSLIGLVLFVFCLTHAR